MRKVRFGRTEAQVPVISLGTWAYGGAAEAGGRSVGWTGHDVASAREAIATAFEAGITHWDTADVYGDGRSEQLLGGMWETIPRADVFLASKVGWDAGSHARLYHPALVRERVERSLVNLKTDVIDLYYLHHCDFGPDAVYLDDALEALTRCRDQGKLRFIGLSDWNSDRIMDVIARVDPDVVQPYRNVAADTYASCGLKAWVDAHDCGVAFFSPIRHGLLLGKYGAPTTFEPGDFRSNDAWFQDAAVLERLRDNRDALAERFADRSSQPVLNALLGALLPDAPSGCVLLGQRNAQQALAAAHADDPLSADEAAWVRSLYADLLV